MIASLLEPKRGRITCYINNKAAFDQRMRYCSRFICSLALFTVSIVRLATYPVYDKIYNDQIENLGKDGIWELTVLA